MAIFSEKDFTSGFAAAQAPSHLIFTRTSGRAPLRARNTIELCGADSGIAAHPQCVSRWKLNLRLRNLPPISNTAAEATTTNDTVCCQSMLET
jgi:hypothetical protein